MITQLRKGFAYALTGLKIVWKQELNFKIHVVSAALVVALGLLIKVSPLEFVALILAISTVLVAETFNTALEELCDKFQPTHDPHIAKIKDLSAAAVLLASIGALIVGLVIFLPHL